MRCLIRLENSPGEVVNGRVYQTSSKQVVTSPCHIGCVDTELRCNLLLVQALVRLRRFSQVLEDSLGNWIVASQVVSSIAACTCLLLLPSTVDCSGPSTGTRSTGRPAGEVEVD